MYKSIVMPTPFDYAIQEQTLTTGQVVQPSIQFNNDCDFELHEIRAVIRKEEPSQSFDGSVLMQMSMANGEFLSNVPIDLFALASVQSDQFSGIPIRLPLPTRVPAASELQVQLTNNTTDTIYVQVILVGFKVSKLT